MYKLWICEEGWWRVLAVYDDQPSLRHSERVNRESGEKVRRVLAGSPDDLALERRSLQRETQPKKGR